MGKDINNDNSFWIRFRSSIILTLITIASLAFNSTVTLGVLAVITVIGLTELYKVVGVNNKLPGYAGYFAAVLLYLSLVPWPDSVSACIGRALANIGGGGAEPVTVALPVIIALFTVILLAVYVFAFPKYDSEQLTMVFFGFFYVALTLSYIYRVRAGECGAYTVWLIFLGSWGSDTSAYMVGRKIGRHKIAPVLSPKKSLEGCIGGIVGAGLLGFIYAMIFRTRLEAGINNPVLVFTVVCLVSGFVSMIGDMAASGIKRNKQIKDYGRLIPGHGGILDRFDSVIFIAPIVYYLLRFLG